MKTQIPCGVRTRQHSVQNPLQLRAVAGDGGCRAVRERQVASQRAPRRQMVIGRLGHAQDLVPGKIEVGQFRIAEIVKIGRVGEDEVNSAIRNIPECFRGLRLDGGRPLPVRTSAGVVAMRSRIDVAGVWDGVDGPPAGPVRSAPWRTQSRPEVCAATLGKVP